MRRFLFVTSALLSIAFPLFAGDRISVQYGDRPAFTQSQLLAVAKSSSFVVGQQLNDFKQQAINRPANITYGNREIVRLDAAPIVAAPVVVAAAPQLMSQGPPPGDTRGQQWREPPVQAPAQGSGREVQQFRLPSQVLDADVQLRPTITLRPQLRIEPEISVAPQRDYGYQQRDYGYDYSPQVNLPLRLNLQSGCDCGQSYSYQPQLLALQPQLVSIQPIYTIQRFRTYDPCYSNFNFGRSFSFDPCYSDFSFRRNRSSFDFGNRFNFNRSFASSFDFGNGFDFGGFDFGNRSRFRSNFNFSTSFASGFDGGFDGGFGRGRSRINIRESSRPIRTRSNIRIRERSRG